MLDNAVTELDLLIQEILLILRDHPTCNQQNSLILLCLFYPHRSCLSPLLNFSKLGHFVCLLAFVFYLAFVLASIPFTLYAHTHIYFG